MWSYLKPLTIKKGNHILPNTLACVPAAKLASWTNPPKSHKCTSQKIGNTHPTKNDGTSIENKTYFGEKRHVCRTITTRKSKLCASSAKRNTSLWWPEQHHLTDKTAGLQQQLQTTNWTRAMKARGDGVKPRTPCAEFFLQVPHTRAGCRRGVHRSTT